MKRIFNSLPVFVSCFFGMCMVQPASAQDEYHHFTANVGGGYASVVGSVGNRLDGGGNFQAGAGFNFNRYLGVLGTFSFNQLGVTRSALNAIDVPDGNGRVYSLTVDPKITFPIGDRASFYLLAGGGWLRRTVEFTKPTLAPTIIVDPWWGYIGPVLVPANQVLGSVTQDAGVWDVGGGFNFSLPRTNMKLYVESRYYEGLTDNTHTTLVPITVGLRW
jgi:opacity protein-like surface antigen